jgi:hypothetical protein
LGDYLMSVTINGTTGITTPDVTADSLTVDSTTLVVDDTNNRVGIGTSSPSTQMEVAGTATIGSGSANYFTINGNSAGQPAYINSLGSDTNVGIDFNTKGTGAFRVNINSSQRIQVNQYGLCFNGDTAAANALDDYEEGTWTPNVYHVSSNNSTWATKQGFYIKIGRQVTAWGRCDSGNSGTAGSALTLSGLPIGADTSAVFAHCAGSYTFNGSATPADKWQITNATVFTAYGDGNNLNQVSYIGFFVTYFTS